MGVSGVGGYWINLYDLDRSYLYFSNCFKKRDKLMTKIFYISTMQRMSTTFHKKKEKKEDYTNPTNE